MNCKHLMVIEFTQTIAHIDMPMIALYNETRIGEEEVRNKIVRGRAENDDFIVVMSKSQYENLKDLIEPDTQKEKEFYENLMLEQQGGII